MSRTYFQDFVRDGGSRITVEFEVDGHYHSILKCWPNTPEHEALAGRLLDLERSVTPTWFRGARIALLRLRMWLDEWLCAPSDAERERWEAWLDEHHLEDYDE